MDAASPTDNVTAVLRRGLLVLVALGLTGTTVELLLLEHYEEASQVVPLALMAVALVGLAVQAARGSRVTVLILRGLMLGLVVTGLVGVVLHYRGNMEFQMEMDATQSGWPLIRKILHAKTPPALAPGSMSQLGLLGLLYTYRHPALIRRAAKPGDRDQVRRSPS